MAGIVNSIIVPTALGVANFGNYNFLISTFKSIQTFLTLSTNTAFFTYGSKNKKSTNSTIIFALWALIQLCFIFFIILFSTQFSGFQEKLFPGQINIYILLIGLLQWINYVSSVTIQFGESKAENVFVQKINFVSSTLATLINVSLYIFDYLTLNTFIISNYVGSLFIIVVNTYYFLIVKKNDYFDSFNFEDLKPTLNYYVEYCKPLVIYGIFGFFSNFFDRWFLQHSDGSIEQGFFSLSFKWISIVMIFTSSLTNIFWRETSVLHSKKDSAKLKQLYFSTMKPIYFLSNFIGLIFFINAERLISLILNPEYYSAVPVMQILAFLPAFAAINRINSIFFYAVEEIKPYRNISIINMIIGILLSYVLVATANSTIPGAGLGSIGVAIKMVLISILLSIHQSFFILKYIGSSILNWFSYQIKCLIVTVFIAVFSNYVIEAYIYSEFLIVAIFIIFFTFSCLIILVIKPQTFGFSKSDVKRIKKLINTKINK